MADMIKLFVNGEEVEVESGKNLVDAIGAVGIEIPHLCYHPALGADGNCRMCLVGIEDGRPPLVPACKTPAMEGMKVQLDTEVIKKIQRDVLEFELINHPVDCPVCDQAGECALQDYYMKYDLADSRMRVDQVKKSKKLDFGCGVVHDQERCILCGRCVRFCRQITKTGELGIVNRTDYARVVTFPGRPLDNRYALNVVDLCPVGAMTSEDFRFKQRVWFMKKNESVCHGCSKGCNVYIDHNKEKYQDDIIYRLRPRHNDQINGYFMCDAGRLSYKSENEDRITEARKKGAATDFDNALQAAAKEIDRAAKVVMLLSPNLSLEQMIAAKAMAVSKGFEISGFSDSYILKGDGDDYLIQDDKSANRAGLELLGIDTTKSAFMDALEGAEVLINLDNILDVQGDKTLLKLMEKKVTICLAAHKTEITEKAEILLPVTSYSEYDGMIVSCDNILQSFNKAVMKNEPMTDTAEVLHLLGGPLGSRAEILAELKKQVSTLGNIDLNQIPAEGLQLT